MAKEVYKLNDSRVVFDTNIEAIKSYVIANGEGVQLSKLQAKLKECIDFTDQLIRAKNGFLKREGIANIIMHRFEVNRDTAFRYMRHAEELYSSSNPLNKRYRILLRLEWCEQQAREAAISGDHKAAAAYESIIQKYIDSYPEIGRESNSRKQVFVIPISVLPGNKHLSEDAAIEVLSSHIDKLENGNETDQFE